MRRIWRRPLIGAPRRASGAGVVGVSPRARNGLAIRTTDYLLVATIG